jgi:glycine oxidase
VRIEGLNLAVLGAGVFGLCVALHAARAGAAVTVFDPAPLGENASGAAAGMIAPVGESLLEEGGPDVFALYAAARDRWPAFAAAAPGLELDRSGVVLHFADEARAAAAEIRARILGADVHRLDGCSLFTLDDLRVDAPQALKALLEAALGAGAALRPRAAGAADLGAFDAVVLAAGFASRALFGQAVPELDALRPIKGHVVAFDSGPSFGPVVRRSDLYLVPRASGLLAGASMEFGASDACVDPEVVERLRRRVVAIRPDLKATAVTGRSGVRAATPDHRPMVGPSTLQGLWLAVGARRNGWLLGPLVGEMMLDYLSGRDAGPFAPSLHPARLRG